MLDITNIQAGDPAKITFSSYLPSKRSRYVPIPRISVPRSQYIGRPGSRRYQRFLNRSFLTGQEVEVETQDLIVFEAPTITPLGSLTEPENRKLFEPFVSVTEEEQQVLFASINVHMTPRTNAADISRQHVSISAAKSFQRIDKKIRKLLKVNLKNDFFRDFDQEIANLIQNGSRALEYSFEDSFGRLICHGICQYYSLMSRSIDTTRGRIVVIERKASTTIPGETLTQYLQRKQTSVDL